MRLKGEWAFFKKLAYSREQQLAFFDRLQEMKVPRKRRIAYAAAISLVTVIEEAAGSLDVFFDGGLCIFYGGQCEKCIGRSRMGGCSFCGHSKDSVRNVCEVYRKAFNTVRRGKE